MKQEAAAKSENKKTKKSFVLGFFPQPKERTFNGKAHPNYVNELNDIRNVSSYFSAPLFCCLCFSEEGKNGDREANKIIQLINFQLLTTINKELYDEEDETFFRSFHSFFWALNTPLRSFMGSSKGEVKGFLSWAFIINGLAWGIVMLIQYANVIIMNKVRRLVLLMGWH